MTVSVGDSIAAAQYNTLQGRINNILGVGSGEDGYGQALDSAQVNAPSGAGAGDGDTVEAEFMQALYDDMNKAYTHQTGNDISAVLKRIADGDVIGADQTGESLTYAGDGSYTFNQASPTTAVKGGFNDYLSAMSTIESGKFNIAAGQADIAVAVSNTRTTDWKGTVDMEFTVTFSSANQRRYFFNAGGEVRIAGSMSGASGAKDIDWSTMLSNTATIQFGYNYTTASSGTGSAIGNSQLTSVYQTVFTKTGSGVYAENEYKVEARTDSTTVLRFRVTLSDNDVGDQQPGVPPGAPPGPAIDENVIGDITMDIGYRTAKSPIGTTTVDVAAPSYSVVNTFE